MANELESVENPLKDTWHWIFKLFRGFPFYFRIVADIFESPPGEPATRLNTYDADGFWKAFNFLSYSILGSFLLLVPIFIAHGDKISRIAFVMRCIAQAAVYGVSLHYLLFLVGARHMKLPDTLTDYCYLSGIASPIMILFAYPALIVAGSK